MARGKNKAKEPDLSLRTKGLSIVLGVEDLDFESNANGTAFHVHQDGYQVTFAYDPGFNIYNAMVHFTDGFTANPAACDRWNLENPGMKALPLEVAGEAVLDASTPYTLAQLHNFVRTSLRQAADLTRTLKGAY
ncbi:hypothetical protein [Corynebacterium freiburgense]|uniref:hypothetical protein n=1 Tax=Corynebacterium freiburgense TaxID=556548 RepID=UPI0003F5A9A2|nr:hypothetical protein [Corynebacterium freiburgense]WJZ01524.1 hypothetical protein CFREI_01080 [Corynebacterium freiburgense]